MALNAPVEAALVRVRGESSATSPTGAGFLISHGLALTCAHVVARALGLEKSAIPAPGQTVTLVFPLISPTAAVACSVEAWWPQNGSAPDDAAVLRLLAAAPAGARPVRLVASGDVSGIEARAGGFPQGCDGAAWARCTILGHSAAGLAQTEDQRTSGLPIQPGFSGGPLWSDDLQGVVRMTVAVAPRPEHRTSYAITGRALIAAAPRLQQRAIPPNPYRGLRAFQPEEHRLFHGREQLVESVTEHIGQPDGELHTMVANGPHDGVATYSLDPDDWIGHLCGLVGDPEFAPVEERGLPPGTQTENLCG
ncbi:hypothetical protein GCM10027570_16190 [Streptomonospora sediminis]